MDKQVPKEESPSFKEAREMAASSMFDMRPGQMLSFIFFLEQPGEFHHLSIYIWVAEELVKGNQPEFCLWLRE